MSRTTEKDTKSCYLYCQSAYDACMRSKEHESVCQMKNNQCVCGCKIP